MKQFLIGFVMVVFGFCAARTIACFRYHGVSTIAKAAPDTLYEINIDTIAPIAPTRYFQVLYSYQNPENTGSGWCVLSDTVWPSMGRIQRTIYDRLGGCIPVARINIYSIHELSSYADAVNASKTDAKLEKLSQPIQCEPVIPISFGHRFLIDTNNIIRGNTFKGLRYDPIITRPGSEALRYWTKDTLLDGSGDIIFADSTTERMLLFEN